MIDEREKKINKQALVTIVIGKNYLDFYNKHFRPSHKRFAEKNKLDLIVITDYIDKTSRGLERHPSWQKLLIFQSPFTQTYDQLCWIDADIYITRKSKNPFLFVKENQWAAVNNNPSNFSELNKTDLDLYKLCPKEKRPDHLINGGFFIVDRTQHTTILEKIYNDYPEQPCYENGPLSYHLLNTPNGVELDPSFNCQQANYFNVHKNENKIKRIVSFVHTNSFIHFCGGINKRILFQTKVIDLIPFSSLFFIKKWLKKILGTKKIFIQKIRYGFRKIKRTISHENKQGLSFAILCVKKTVYGDMVIDNVNSLHYLNPNHTVTIYCDTVCFEYLTRKKNKFDYTDKITVTDAFGESEKPWQYYKIETLIQASKNNQILTDADGIWHDDPVVDKEKITILVVSNKISERPDEVNIIQNIFNKPEWSSFKHYVTGFVSIPSRFMTSKLEKDLRDFNDRIFTNPLDFVPESTRDGLRRLSEELGTNLALQANYNPDMFTTLKTEDGPGSKQSLESLYYGCLNQINE